MLETSKSFRLSAIMWLPKRTSRPKSFVILSPSSHSNELLSSTGSGQCGTIKAFSFALDPFKNCVSLQEWHTKLLWCPINLWCITIAKKLFFVIIFIYYFQFKTERILKIFHFWGSYRFPLDLKLHLIKTSMSFRGLGNAYTSKM